MLPPASTQGRPTPRGVMNEGVAREEFAAFYSEAFPVVHRVARSLCPAQDAWDVTQEAFARTLCSWDRISNYRSPIAFTVRAVVNLARTRFRSLRRVDSRGSWLLMVGAPDERAAEDFAGVENEVIIEGLLKRLPRRQREALVLCDLLGYRGDDAAAVLGIRPSTLRVHLSRARDFLRRELRAGPDGIALGGGQDEPS
jgi:RNA polymerase sigma-70 factor (ECF subfamily)